jgi:Na+/phosphate symporter
MSKQKSTPEDVIQQLRAVRSTIEEDDIAPMTAQQRRDVRDRIRHSRETISAAMSAVGMSDKVAGAIGMSSDEVKELIMLTTRWGAVESDLRELFNGVSSANLKRRHKLEMIADHIFAVTKHLVRARDNENLTTIYEQMQRLRKLERQKKTRRRAEDTAEDAETKS